MTELRETMSMNDLRGRLGYKSDTSIYKLLNKDETFPRPFNLANRNHWFKDEVDEWQAHRIENAAKHRKEYAGGASYG